MKKRVSKRRWKARAAAGRELPLTAIVEYDLACWFKFVQASPLREVYRVQQ